MNARVFINYRRSDSAGWARQLHAALAEHFGKERVFRDVAIEPGVDFVDHIDEVMNVCEVCLVVIGQEWATTRSAAGTRRLDEPDDLVRREIERALERPDVQVIPVLVDGARMPGEHELPAGLRPLARRNACELTDLRWDYDIERLCQRLRSVLGESTMAGVKPPQPQPAEPDEPWWAALAIVAAAAGSGAIGAALTDPLAGKGSDDDASRIAAYAIERGVLWAIIGGLVAIVATSLLARTRIVRAAFSGTISGALGGAAGGAAFAALNRLAEVDGQRWSMAFLLVGIPALALSAILARAAGRAAGGLALGALGGAALAALITDGGRSGRLTLHALLIVAGAAAVLALTRRGAGSRRGLTSARASRGASAPGTGTSSPGVPTAAPR